MSTIGRINRGIPLGKVSSVITGSASSTIAAMYNPISALNFFSDRPTLDPITACYLDVVTGETHVIRTPVGEPVLRTPSLYHRNFPISTKESMHTFELNREDHYWYAKNRYSEDTLTSMRRTAGIYMGSGCTPSEGSKDLSWKICKVPDELWGECITAQTLKQMDKYGQPDE